MFDLLITGGLLIDGTGAPALRGDLAIQDGKIAARGNLTGARAARTIDAAGFCVTPGFLDIHRHADAALFLGNVRRSKSIIISQEENKNA